MTLPTLLLATFAALTAAFVNVLTGSHHDPLLFGIWTGAATISGWKLCEERAREVAG